MIIFLKKQVCNILAEKEKNGKHLQILEIEGNQYRVNCLVKAKEGWRFNRRNVAWYPRNRILRSIRDPVPLNTCVSSTRTKSHPIAIEDAGLEGEWGL